MQQTTAPLVSGGAPIIGHTMEFLREPVALLQRGSREHGEVFGLRLAGQKAVVLLGADNHRFFFTETDRRLSIRTGMPFFRRMFDPDFYVFADSDEYRRQRDLVLPRFQGEQMNRYVQVMERQVRALAEQLGTAGSFDLVRTLGPMVMRIAADAFLGADFARRLGDEFFTEFRRFSAGMDVLAPPWLPLPHLIRSRRARDRLRAMLAGLLAERRRRPIDPPDFLQMLADARYRDGTAVPDLVRVNLILMLTWAGHETTTGHLAWALIDLLQHPGELDVVRRELQSEIDDAPLSPTQVHRLKHIDRALHETERLHPVAYILQRTADEAFERNGHHIPAGTRVFISPAVSHRLPDVYPEPDRYQPGRFLADPRSMRDLVGFGGGVHRCLGVHFAYLEMTVVLARLLQWFDLELQDTDPRPVAGPKTKWPASPCRVRYRRRAPIPAAT
jgi:sterol 14-demethylase